MEPERPPLTGLGIPLEESPSPWPRWLAFVLVLTAWAAAFGYWLLPWAMETQRYARDHWFGWGALAGILVSVLATVLFPAVPWSAGGGRRGTLISIALTVIVLVAIVAGYELSRG